MANYGWIVEGGAFAKKPLMGKTCREYAAAALEGAELKEAPFSFQPEDMLIALREDAPLLTREDAETLLQAAKERPCVLRTLETGLPMAAAMNGEAAARLLNGLDALPGVEELLGLLDAGKMEYDLWPEEGDDCDCDDDCDCGCEHGRGAVDPDRLLLVNDARSYTQAYMFLNEENVRKHMENGVIFLDPYRVIVESDVTIAPGATIYPGNTLQGATCIGEDCVLLPNNRINNARVGRGCTVESSVLLNCAVGEETTVGPYAYLRPDARIGSRCRIGDFVEVKNSSIDDGTKVSHLTYVGDSDLGKNINLGCGVVFVNYDGKTKNRSRVDDHAFIGCNCNLVAPVHVGKNAYLAAGSTVTEDVPEDALFVARSRGVTKEGWVVRRKEAGKL